MDGMGASECMKWKCEGNILIGESRSGMIILRLFDGNDIIWPRL